jgi:Vesicle transport v-SNARE protein N-terminus
MSIFKSHEEQFTSECQKISQCLVELKDSSSSGNKPQEILTEMRNLIKNADATLVEMSIELRTLNLAARAPLTEKLSFHRTTLSSYRVDFER